MKKLFGAAFAASILASAAVADIVMPADVKYGDEGVATSISGMKGDAASGRAVFSNRKLGNCLACHMNSDLSEESFHGEVGPPMDGVAGRWTEPELRAIVANSKSLFEETIMPAFYVDAGYERPLEKFQGKTILTAQQVEDVVAYLLTLTEE